MRAGVLGRRSVLSWAGGMGAMLLCGLPGEGTASADEAAPTLEGLLALFARAPGISADFVERKHIALLEAPLENHGKLYYLRDRHLAREVIRPSASRMLLSGDRLILSDAAGRREMDVGAHAAVRALVEAFMHVLRGDRAALDRDFLLTLRAEGERWKLALAPRRAPLSKLLVSLQVEGQGIVVGRLRVKEASGDESITDFSNVNSARRYTAEERRSIFEISGN